MNVQPAWALAVADGPVVAVADAAADGSAALEADGAVLEVAPVEHAATSRVNAAVRVLPDDAAAAHPDAVSFPDLARLQQAAMEDLARGMTPVFGAIRRRTRLGIPAMWGAVADTIGWAALADANAARRGPACRIGQGA